jgi:hypothetical protein
MGVAEGGRGGDAEGGHQLMRERTLDQMGKEISAAARELSWEQRMDVAAALLEDLRKPVGTLRRKDESEKRTKDGAN